MKQLIWLMCTFLILACCGLVDAGAREKMAIAAAVDALLQSNTPALPDTLNGGQSGGNSSGQARFHNIEAAEEEKTPAVQPLEIYSPAWCGVCSRMEGKYTRDGHRNGNDQLPLKWVHQEAWFRPPGYPLIYDPATGKYTWGSQSWETLQNWARTHRKP